VHDWGDVPLVVAPVNVSLTHCQRNVAVVLESGDAVMNFRFAETCINSFRRMFPGGLIRRLKLTIDLNILLDDRGCTILRLLSVFDV
jgi:hypothetical protein